jgi:hypothetical protein
MQKTGFALLDGKGPQGNKAGFVLLQPWTNESGISVPVALLFLCENDHIYQKGQNFCQRHGPPDSGYPEKLRKDQHTGGLKHKRPQARHGGGDQAIVQGREEGR